MFLKPGNAYFDCLSVSGTKSTVSAQESASNSKINHSSHCLAEVRKDGTKTIICLVVFWVTMPLNCREEGDWLQTFCEK